MADDGKRSRARRVTLLWRDTREEMDRTESRLIQCHQPDLNIQGIRRCAQDAAHTLVA